MDMHERGKSTAAAAEQFGRVQRPSPTMFSQLHMMIFDDDAGSRNELRQTLKIGGGTFIAEAGSREVATRTAQFPSSLDVILCATHLANGSGLRLLKAVRTGFMSPIPPNTPFVLIAEEVSADVLSAAALLDVNGYIVKPYSATSLRQVILRGLSKTIKLDHSKYLAVRATDVH